MTTLLKAKRGIKPGRPNFAATICDDYGISPILHRSSQKLQFLPNYNYHPKCEKLRITNLCFADDLLLFVRGDAMSVQMMMDVLGSFSESTGLRANVRNVKFSLVEFMVKWDRRY